VREIKPAAWLAFTVYNRVLKKLQTEPIEDNRIDFEDGYGNRPTTRKTAMPWRLPMKSPKA
jgi:hypothetical protein